jgi:hypothetical protein
VEALQGQGVQGADQMMVWVAHRGDFYHLGVYGGYYVIWHNQGGRPLAQFPKTPQGWAEAWHQYQGWEQSARSAVGSPPITPAQAGRGRENLGARMRRWGTSYILLVIGILAILGGIGLLTSPPDPGTTRAQSVSEGIGALVVGAVLLAWWGFARLRASRSGRPGRR